MDSPHTNETTTGAHDPHRLEAQRRENRERVRELGMAPYGVREEGLLTLEAARDGYDPDADEANKASLAARKAHTKGDPGSDAGGPPELVDDRPVVKIAGRVVLSRDNGKLVWLNLRDHTLDSFQVAVSKRDCDDSGFALAKVLDVGDIVVARGPLTRTNTGEVTCWASSLRPGSKCLVPPPEKHAGLTDTEARYRRRYLDMWVNPETTRVLRLRSALLRSLRRFMDGRGFDEVETPMLQTQAGGAAARPFVTHMNALSIDLFLRIAPELYLKRLLVGGMPRVYEVNRNFRNEGLDRSHNPEFTSLEVYEAFGDYSTMMELAESLVRDLARSVGSDPSSMRFGDFVIDYERPFERASYAELFERTLGFPLHAFDRAREEASARGLKTTGTEGGDLAEILIVNGLFEEVVEREAIDPARPTFVVDYPAALSPLTRPKAGTEGDPVPLAERWDLFIGGMEIGPAYTELNDPDIQETKFREQLAGVDDEESTFRTYDEDFIEALKVGMPPAGGLGLGVDRLVMLLTDSSSIRDVLPFPMMRPRAR